MAVTGKELAEQLGISAAAVSMALNGKPGVGDALRAEIIEAARAHGYDFSRVEGKREREGAVAFVIYKKSGAVVTDSPFFSQLAEGISRGCRLNQCALRVFYVYEKDDVAAAVGEIKGSHCAGIVLLATEMQEADLTAFRKCGIPLVVLDAYFETVAENYILINNVQGAYNATDYIIRRCKCQPGYLHSAYSIANFEERADGFYKAVRAHGMSSSKSIVHRLTPSIEGAYADMSVCIRQGDELAGCYFADNDMLAIGAMRALAEAGCRIPEDISIIGFDDISYCQSTNPPLTTVSVPKMCLGQTAVERLLAILKNPDAERLKIELSTQLVKRKSVR